MRINNVEFNATLDDILQELVNQLRLNNIQYIQKLQPTPTHIQICCPYHAGGQEHRPSAGIRRSDGLFHCFACGEVHSLCEVISYCFGHKDPLGKYGWMWLVKNFATVQVENRKPIELNISRDRKSVKEDVQYITEDELNKYRYYHPYWKKRGIKSEEIIELFDLGYDKKTRCITMPVRDINGNCVFVARRSVQTKWFNYPQGVHKPIYGLYEYNLEREKLNNMYLCMGRGCGKTQMMRQITEKFLNVFICESMIDALLLWQSGFFAFALNGLGSTAQFSDLKEVPCRKYILCTDNDKAGKQARNALKKAINNKLITEIIFPDNRKDVGECTKEEIDNILNWEVF